MKNSDLSIPKTDFTMRRPVLAPKLKGKPSGIPGGLTRKSSYIVPVDLQDRLKILAVKNKVNLNSIIIEALEDILAKYGG